LVDRSGCPDRRVHEKLHRSFVDALEPCGPDSDGSSYFDGFPLGGDGGYLRTLVERVRLGIGRLPGYRAVREQVVELARLYAGMQSTKHVHPSRRERAMMEWHAANCEEHLAWWEFGAAAGSTLAIFALLALAADASAGTADALLLRRAYFPYVCAFHIMLDYLIDRDEDSAYGDLNFTRQYPTDGHFLEALCGLYDRARNGVSELPDAGFHERVLDGLVAVYMSDPKARAPGISGFADVLLERAPRDARAFYVICRLLKLCRLL
ncbi:MAG: tetraprenyl-beta-curcumene synthase family protein, partial [Firmicutes bacterium]|nr:tetraprenyl-beta-curcumene synthase family protein [Bacillota bacterium]